MRKIVNHVIVSLIVGVLGILILAPSSYKKYNSTELIEGIFISYVIAAIITWLGFKLYKNIVQYKQ